MPTQKVLFASKQMDFSIRSCTSLPSVVVWNTAKISIFQVLSFTKMVSAGKIIESSSGLFQYTYNTHFWCINSSLKQNFIAVALSLKVAEFKKIELPFPIGFLSKCDWRILWTPPPSARERQRWNFVSADDFCIKHEYYMYTERIRSCFR